MVGLRTHSSKAVFPFLWLLSGLFAGCGHETVTIKATTAPPLIDSNNPQSAKNIPGIPFYVTHGVCKKETVWAEPKYTLQVDVLVDGKAAASRSIVLSRGSMLGNVTNDESKARLKNLLAGLNALAAARQANDLKYPNDCPAEVAKNWDKTANESWVQEQKSYCEESNLLPPGCATLAGGVQDGNLLRIANTAGVVNEVDYRHVYYINTHTPWIGNATVNPKINADGTLSEVNAQVNDQTWSTILSTVASLAGDVGSFASARVTAAAGIDEARIAAGARSADKSLFQEDECRPAPGWPLPKPGNAKEQPAKPAITYQFSIKASIILHDHVEKDDLPSGGKCEAAPNGVTGGSMTITEKNVPGSSGKDEKDDANSIKISGEVTLPKAGNGKDK
jgi:hypothetical protein